MRGTVSREQRSHRRLIVTLPNFGDERAIADTLRLSALESTRSGAGDSGCSVKDDHRASSRQFLRQDVRLQ